MVYVCDAIMGSGKSQSAITYMNENPERPFLYITPYLDETKRIAEGCPLLRFVQPSGGIEEFHFSKVEHTLSLVREGRNIATTHQAFKMYTREMVREICDRGYTVIVDEAVEVVEQCKINYADVELATNAGIVELIGDEYRFVDGVEYRGELMRPFFSLMGCRDLMRMKQNKKTETCLYWQLPAELFRSENDVFILTYLFEGQDLSYMFQMSDIRYQYIGVSFDGQTYRFCMSGKDYVPGYVSRIRDMIRVLDNPKMNQIGEVNGEYTLSKSWFMRQDNDHLIERLRDNIYNVFRNVWGREYSSKERMWGTYKKTATKLKGKGYTNGYIVFNQRASNAYRHKRALVYAANPFMQVDIKKYFESRGVLVNEDLYALSTLVQWIWRSAIRDGEAVDLYLPSVRMRKLLDTWMTNLEKEVSQE